MLDGFERHYGIPAPITGAFDFVVNGDHPRGAECIYDSAGVRVPALVRQPIMLYGLTAEFKEITSGNQIIGLFCILYAVITNNGGQIFLAKTVMAGVNGMASWYGQMPTDWGFGVSVPMFAGLDVTHKLVLKAQYARREP